MIPSQIRRLCAGSVLSFLVLAIASPAFAQNSKSSDQLPDDFRGVKVYKLPTQGGQPEPNIGIYRDLAFKDINVESLQLALSLSIRAVDHPATVEHIYFQDVKVNGVPVHVDAYNQEFKLSNKEPVDVPSPLNCTIVFAELDSLQPVRELVDRNAVTITGQSFIEVKLTALESVAEMARHVVIPLPLQENVPLTLFNGNPLLRLTATTVLDNLITPTSTLAINMAREHLAKLRLSEALGQRVKAALYIVLTQFQVRDPKTGTEEQFSVSGTGFLGSGDGKLITTKRVVAPWKFDPEVDFLIEHKRMQLDEGSVKFYAWPAGGLVVGLDGQPNLAAALSTEHQSLKLVRTAPDEVEERDYVDPASGKHVKLHLESEGFSNVALLQLSGSGFQPLGFSLNDPPLGAGQESNVTLCSYPFGMSQPQATPRLLTVHMTLQGKFLTSGHQLDPGESGAPLLDSGGNVVALATTGNVNIPIQAVKGLLP
jgi:hypothetical protein